MKELKFNGVVKRCSAVNTVVLHLSVLGFFTFSANQFKSPGSSVPESLNLPHARTHAYACVQHASMHIHRAAARDADPDYLRDPQK